MFKLMIVEDESWIQAGLLKYFNWAELGFSSISEAENGLDAIEKARVIKPDFILTDIRMPKMDGLELIEHLRAELPDCVFVILSGYEDFTYAKKAIQLGVTAYLIKPLQYEESMKTIQECISKMKERIQRRENQEKLKKTLEESEQISQEKYIKELMEQEFSEEEWKKRCEMYKLPIMKGWYITAMLSFIPEYKDQWDVHSENVKSLWMQVSRDFPECRVFSYTSGKNRYFLISAGNRTQLSAYVTAVVQLTMEKNHHIYGGIGSEAASCTKIRESRQLAENAARYRFFKDGESIFYSCSIAGVKGYPFQFAENQKMILIQAIEQADEAKIKALMKQFSAEVHNHKTQATPDKLFVFIQEIIGTCVRFVHKHGIDLKDIYHAKLFSYQLLDDFSTLDDLFTWLGEFIYTIGTNYKDASVNSTAVDTRIFDKIEKYIVENIAQDITLNEVATIFFYNPAYLSRLFKNKLNKNYTIFISEIRINYAKECLKDPSVSVSEVGPLCGYQSYKHFVKTFKKVTGLTPTDYRKRLGETG